MTHLRLEGKRALVLGLGINQGGIGVARFLARHGAQVRVTDLQPTENLSDAVRELDDLDISFTLGRHDPVDIDWADIVVRNPAVPRESTWLEMARDSGAQVEMEMTLFFRACRAPIAGITGTKGKTTTSSILWTLLQERWPDAPVAGNMGRSALSLLDDLDSKTPVVVELSSFQLEGLDEQSLGPDVAIVTNVSPDHLDRYASFEEYAATKATIARHLRPGGVLIWNRDDDVSRDLFQRASVNQVTFGMEDDPGFGNSIWIENEWFMARWKGERAPVAPLAALSLPGRHNQINALAAIAGALALEAPVDAIERGLRRVSPVADRLETVATVADVLYVNDTTATAPGATRAAVETFAGKPLVVIAGGSDKGVSLEPLAETLASHASFVVLLDGSATGTLERALGERGFERYSAPLSSMAEAIEMAAELVEPGGVVLLSPGCASFGMFRNEFARGEAFRAAVLDLRAGLEDAE